MVQLHGIVGYVEHLVYAAVLGRPTEGAKAISWALYGPGVTNLRRTSTVNLFLFLIVLRY